MSQIELLAARVEELEKFRQTETHDLIRECTDKIVAALRGPTPEEVEAQVAKSMEQLKGLIGHELDTADSAVPSALESMVIETLKMYRAWLNDDAGRTEVFEAISKLDEYAVEIGLLPRGE